MSSIVALYRGYFHCLLYNYALSGHINVCVVLQPTLFPPFNYFSEATRKLHTKNDDIAQNITDSLAKLEQNVLDRIDIVEHVAEESEKRYVAVNRESSTENRGQTSCY